MGVKELEATLNSIPEDDKSNGVEFRLTVRPDEMTGFMQRLAKWFEVHHISKFVLDWDGISARVKISY